MSAFDVTGYQTELGIVRLCGACMCALRQYDEFRETPIAGAEPVAHLHFGAAILAGYPVRQERDGCVCDACDIFCGVPPERLLRRIRRRRLPEGVAELCRALGDCGLVLRQTWSRKAPNEVQLRRAVRLLEQLREGRP